MLITILGRMKVWVVQAHTSGQALVVKKTRLLDFATSQAATRSIDILLGLMGSDH